MSLTAFEDDDNLTHEQVGEDAVLHKGKLPEGRRHPHEAQPVIETTNVRNVASNTKVVAVDPVSGERAQVAGPVDPDANVDAGAEPVAEVDATADDSTEETADESGVIRKLPRKKDK